MRSFKIFPVLLILTGFAIISKAEITIIPRPASVVTGKGVFKLSSKTQIISGRNTLSEANYLTSLLEKGFGKKPAIKRRGKGIILILNLDLKGRLGEEGYILKSQADRIIIEGGTTAGIFYGIQSLRQLLPANFEFNPEQSKTIAVPVVEVTDKPRFPWRAFMLDEARNFKGMEVVKSLLDQMALLKMNIFHWHLTDDQGWRIEIKKYPNLTTIGAFRKDTQTKPHSSERSGVAHGGFYTQAQIKEIIEYATVRHIQIVPEIEMPGHAMAAIAAYPWLGTLGTTTEVPVTFGKMYDSYNIADPRVIQFIEDVLKEVFQVFPGNIVHIGGDEVKLDTWENSEMMKALMKKEGLSSPADLQIFFTNKISNFIDSNGHRMMGWNEILGGKIHDWQKEEDVEVEQKLAQTAIIHFWKGSLGMIEKAVAEGYDVVNSYYADTYLDYDYNKIPLSRAYAFDPIPEGLSERYYSKILGTGCQMWGEWIPTVDKMDQQIFPRLAAYAEVGWTPKSEKNFTRFVGALAHLKIMWKSEGINYNDDIK